MTAALTRRKAAEVGLELETNLRRVCSCTITEKDPTRAFSWLKAATTAAFTLKKLLRLYTKQALIYGKYMTCEIGPSP